MAHYPCDTSGHRYLGPQNSAYVGIIRASERDSKKLRLCGDHFRHLLDDWGLVRSDTDDGQLPLPVMQCWRDEGELEYDTRFAVFVTAYPAGHGREDYFVELCRGCVSRLAVEFSLPIP